MSEPTTSAPTVEPIFDQSHYISKLESQNARAQREIVALSRLLMETSLAPVATPTPEALSAVPVFGEATRKSMFKVMAMTLHLTRVPVIMRFGFFKRRHQARLAKALKDHRLIDPEWYAKTYPEVAKSGQDPVLYFVSKGIDAGHIPHPDFAQGI